MRIPTNEVAGATRDPSRDTLSAPDVLDCDAGRADRVRRLKQLVLTHVSGLSPEADILAEAAKSSPNRRVAADFDHIVI
jgi:hypothetical protein